MSAITGLSFWGHYCFVLLFFLKIILPCFFVKYKGLGFFYNLRWQHFLLQFQHLFWRDMGLSGPKLGSPGVSLRHAATGKRVSRMEEVQPRGCLDQCYNFFVPLNILYFVTHFLGRNRHVDGWIVGCHKIFRYLSSFSTRLALVWPFMNNVYQANLCYSPTSFYQLNATRVTSLDLQISLHGADMFFLVTTSIQSPPPPTLSA